MKRLSAGICASIVIGVGGASTAFADNPPENPLGFYIGAGVGESNVRSDNGPQNFGFPGYYDEHHAAWKVMAGVRPIALVGAEVEYIDFGNPGNGYGYYNYNYYGQNDHPTATAAFAVGYLPIPTPFLDVYGKVGVARLQSDITGFVNSGGCTANGVCANNAAATPYRQNQWNTDFAYGAGVQAKFFPGLAVRAEYERISQTGGDPDAVTVGVTWAF
jgi:opacity protein-like surface antigen